MSDLYILGAGFSRAISSSMPLVRGLSTDLSRYGTTAVWEAEVFNLFQKDFEEGLSYLAENKPFLTASENLRHQHLLLDVTRNLAMHIGISQCKARAEIEAGGAAWIVPLIAHWVDSRAEVITLNYDTLVEELAIAATNEAVSYRAIYPPTIVPATARGGGGSWADYADFAPTFGFYKLHGSLNWYHSERQDAHTDTVYFVAGPDVPGTTDQRPPESVTDKGPFIVAPVPAKGSLIHHDTMRSIWRDAATAVKAADRIFVLGYSMPTADRLFAQLIRGRLFNKKPPIEIINPDDTLCAHVTNLFKDEHCMVTQRYSGKEAIRDFVNAKAFLPSQLPI